MAKVVYKTETFRFGSIIAFGPGTLVMVIDAGVRNIQPKKVGIVTRNNSVVILESGVVIEHKDTDGLVLQELKNSRIVIEATDE